MVLDSLLYVAAPFRTRRNKQLAHLDLLTSMRASPYPLPDVSRKMIENALSLVRQYLNSIEQYYNDSQIGYEHFIMNSDGDALLALLRYGLRYEELLIGHEISYDDFRKGKWNDA